MQKIVTGALAALTLGAGALAGATPAAAQHYGGYRGDYRRSNDGAAIGAGLLGLAVGAAVASDHRGYGYGYGYAPAPAYSYGYAPGYYDPGYYGPPPVYYPRYGYYYGGRYYRNFHRGRYW